MESRKERKRSVNLDTLSAEQAEAIGNELGKKVTEYVDEAIEKANKLLAIYGLKAKMQCVIMGINEDAPREPLD